MQVKDIRQLEATELLRMMLSKVCMNEQRSAIAYAELLVQEMQRGNMPVFSLLRPADCYNPDPERLRVAI